MTRVARCELRDCLLGGVIEDDAANGLPGAARECEYGRGRPRFVRCCDVFHVGSLNRLELKNNWHQGDDAGIGRVSNENGIPHDRAGDPTQPTWQSGCRGGREKLFLESLVLEAEEFAGALRLHGPPQVPQPANNHNCNQHFHGHPPRGGSSLRPREQGPIRASRSMGMAQ